MAFRAANAACGVRKIARAFCVFVGDCAGRSGNKVVGRGAFGLLAFFAKELAFGRRTYNARSETVATLPSYRDAWRRGQRCIVPAEAIFEPNWETGKAVRWRISQVGDVPMGIAGIYTRWRHPEDGRAMSSFAMLTVNADSHLLMRRFHRPGEEKRMVVVLDPADHDAWLACSVDEAPRFFKQWIGELVAVPDPLIRAPRAVSGKVMRPPSEADPTKIIASTSGGLTWNSQLNGFGTLDLRRSARNLLQPCCLVGMPPLVTRQRS